MATRACSPEVEHAYARARELCQQVGETPELFPVLFGLWRFCLLRSELQTARELGESCCAWRNMPTRPGARYGWPTYALGATWILLGEFASAHQHLEQGSALYTPASAVRRLFRMGHDPGVACLCHVRADPLVAGVLRIKPWQHSHEALTLAQELSHPYSLAFALVLGRPWSHQFRRDVPAVQEQAEAALTLATEQGFPSMGGRMERSLRGWALAMQDRARWGSPRSTRARRRWATGQR